MLHSIITQKKYEVRFKEPEQYCIFNKAIAGKTFERACIVLLEATDRSQMGA